MNKIQDAFSSIKASDEMKDKSLDYIKRRISCKPMRTYKKAAVSIICAALILCSGMFSFSAFAMPKSYISIDSASSIELCLNGYNRVVKATAYDDGGEKILSNISIKWDCYWKAINTINNCAKEMNIVDDNSFLDITVSSINDDEIIESIEQNVTEVNVKCHSENIELSKEAQKHNISPGKYRAYLTIKKYDISFTIEDAKAMPMCELKSKISEYTGDSAYQGQNGQGNSKKKSQSCKGTSNRQNSNNHNGKGHNEKNKK